jgi:HSP90 family molecular chaperone
MDQKGRTAKTAAKIKIFEGVKSMVANLEDLTGRDIIVIPPERVDTLTDDEEEVENQNGEDLASIPKEIVGTIEIDITDDEDVNEPKSSITPKWKKGELQMERAFPRCNDLPKIEEIFPVLASKKPYELFQFF